MRILTNKEICALSRGSVTRTTPNATYIDITPFNFSALKQDSYTLHAGNRLIVHHQRKDQFATINSQGFLLSPKYEYTIEVAEKIKIHNLEPLFLGVTGATMQTKDNSGNCVVRISPIEPYFIYPNSEIAHIKFISRDNIIPQKVPDWFEAFFASEKEKFVVFPSKLSQAKSL